MLFIVAILVPFILFLGGSFLLHYPITLGALYAVNFVMIYMVLWAVVNQVVKINTQKIEIEGNALVLIRKKMFISVPLLREQDIEIPLSEIREITLIPTGVGYQLTVRFASQEKLLGMDIDINPLNSRNQEIIKKVLKLKPEIIIDDKSLKILDEYSDKIASWKTVYFMSTVVICLALILFLGISLYIGPKFAIN